MKTHNYKVKVEWTGNRGKGTKKYDAYSRAHTISSSNKKVQIEASSDPSFRGDPSKYNPEELFLSSISSCHMLWYLHLCSVNKIVIVEYIDHATGLMEETKDGSGRFTLVTLSPRVVIQNGEGVEKAKELHLEANKMCFIANSCNFRIGHEVDILVEG